MDSLRKVSSVEIDQFLRKAFSSVGLTKPQTDSVVDLLVTTSLRGVDTHGIVLAERYIEGSGPGRSTSGPDPRS